MLEARVACKKMFGYCGCMGKNSAQGKAAEVFYVSGHSVDTQWHPIDLTGCQYSTNGRIIDFLWITSARFDWNYLCSAKMVCFLFFMILTLKQVV